MSTNFRFDNSSHTYWFGDRKVTGITEAIGRAGLSPKIPEVAQKNFEYAAGRGTSVHKACELDDMGQSQDFQFDPQVDPYLDAWRKFNADFNFDPDLVELPMGHTVYMFGGTLDCAGMSKDGYVIVERKTRAFQDHDEFQVAGQELLVRDVAGKKVTGRLVVSLANDGRYSPRWCRDRQAQPLFLAAVAVANWQISRGR